MTSSPGIVPRSVPLLTLGHLAGWLARALGWSPLGAILRLHGAEGPRAALLEGRRVRVLAVEPDALRVELLEPPGTGATTGLAPLRLTARHAGYPPHSLRFMRIAVVVSDPARRSPDAEASLAIATLERPSRSA